MFCFSRAEKQSSFLLHAASQVAKASCGKHAKITPFSPSRKDAGEFSLERSTPLLIFHSEVSQRARKVKPKLSRRPPGREHVRVNMNISLCTQFDEALCSLFSLAFKVYLTEAPRLTRVGTFTRSAVAGGGYFRTLHQKTGEREHMCVGSLLAKGRGRQRGARLLFSPGARGSGWF